MEDYKILNEIKKIIDSNVTYVPYEGDEINKEDLKHEIFNFIKELIK